LIADEDVRLVSSRPVTDPHDGRVVAHASEASEHEVDQAIEVAHQAAKLLRVAPRHVRADALDKAADSVLRNHDLFATTIAVEGVKTIREARREVQRCVITLRACADLARRGGGATVPIDSFEGESGQQSFWTREPVGLVAAITPFNDPLNLVAHKVGPALAAGNAVIVKPHEETPLTARLLGEAFRHVGLPLGAMQVVLGSGVLVGGHLVRHPYVDMISFTGGRKTAQHIVLNAGIKRLSMELGQSGATIVLDDADLAVALPLIVRGAVSAAGQNCLHVQRLIVQSPIYDQVVAAISEAFRQVRTGAKLLETTDMGPLISEPAADRVRAMVRDALDAGGHMVVGSLGAGTTIPPVLLTDVPADHPSSTQEIFGPVTLVTRVDGVDEAVHVANKGNGAIQTAVFTNSLQSAQLAIQNIEAGSLVINDSTDFRIDTAPFGGTKAAGIGREGVGFAVEAMSEPKIVYFRGRHGESPAA